MKVKFIEVNEDHKDSYGEDGVTLGEVYDCYRITVWGSALIYDDEGHKSLLRKGEYEVVEE